MGKFINYENDNKKKRIIFLIVLLIIISLPIIYLVFVKKDNDENNNKPIEGITSLSFDYEKYVCKVGEDIEINLKYSFKDSSVNIESYEIIDKDVALLNKVVSDDKSKVQKFIIKCLNEGNTNLKVISSDNVEVSANINVENETLFESNQNTNPDTNQNPSNNTGTTQTPNTTPEVEIEKNNKISFDKDSYTCKAGENITALITTSDATVSSFKSSDTSIATIIEHPYVVSRCPNCEDVLIYCLKDGNVTLSAVSSTGAETKVNLKVEKNPEDKSIKFDKDSYTCKVGEKITALITATDSTDMSVRVSSFSSSNTKLATIKEHPFLISRCPNCEDVEIECLNEGNVILSAKSSTGAETKVNLQITK